MLNRTRRGGVLVPGAALTKNGNGGGSRWYPATLGKRLQNIAGFAEQISFDEGDGVRLLGLLAANPAGRVIIDPPYTAGGKRAGSRLYAHSEIEHALIFETLAESGADFLMIYDCAPPVVELVQTHGFQSVTVQMKNGHHAGVGTGTVAGWRGGESDRTGIEKIWNGKP